MPDRTIVRIGSVLAIVGAILGIIVLILHARVGELEYGDFGYSEASLQNIADSPEWVGVHLGILCAALLLTGALLGLYRSITTEPGKSWAQLGFTAALLGGGLIAANMAVDGLALKVVADAWDSGPPEERYTFFRIGNSMAEIALALFSIWIIVFWGLTFVLYGLAVSLSDVYPKWLGWGASVVGTVGIVIGVVQAFNGPSTLVSNVLFGVVAVLLTVWLLVIGGLMWRNSAGSV